MTMEKQILDLTEAEIQRFVGKDPVSFDEVLEIHKNLKRKSIWKLLQQNEKYSAKKQEA